MQLRIETFDNVKGGNAFFKAVTHPRVARAAADLVARLRRGGPVAVYDPLGYAEGFAAIHDLGRVDLAGSYVQDVTAIGQPVLGCTAQPVTDLRASGARTVFVAAFDAHRLVEHIRHLVPREAEIVTLDSVRLPDELLTVRRNYLDPLNFATNFVFFRDTEAEGHTRLVTANYWAGYGAGSVALEVMLFDAGGKILAEWRETVESGGGDRGGAAPAAPARTSAIVLDSREIRARFGLPEFTGQLFLHVVGAAGHDVVKYALDTIGPREDGSAGLSCTHDANSWPADFYAGLPAPHRGERVTLWIQNSLPRAIPAGAVGLNRMGDGADVRRLDREVPAFATMPVEVASLFPEARWPEQFEVRAGRYFVRPRYEVTGGSGGGADAAAAAVPPRTRIAHVNVERTDLKPDPRIAELGNLLGKGFLLPAPVLPQRRWRSVLLPTPMATGQLRLPIAALVYDASGREVATRSFGNLARRESVALDLDDLLDGTELPGGGFGHVELVYDFAAGRDADGWLHALFRYEDRESGHAAETSFGAHVFNTVLTYKGEPQSYAGRPPGLSTRLFLRLGQAPLDTLCHLIYPASTPWHEKSATDLILYDGAGVEVAREHVAIACSGSLFWRYQEMFDAATRRRAGENAYLVVRDATCRLFGYHGLIGGAGAFSLDHMFGF
jgi:hypothetical protein